jgi:hypothetical protein
MADTQQPPDPFGAQGGGHWTGAQWVPKNHPLAQKPGQTPDTIGTPNAAPGLVDATASAPPPSPPAGGAMPPSPPAATQPGVPVAGGTPGAVSAPPLQDATPTSPNPFTSHPAGGVWLPGTQQWVPGDHPLAQTAGAQPGGGQPAPGGQPPGDQGIPPLDPTPPPGSTTPPPPQIPVGDAPPDAADAAFRDALLEMLSRDPSKVSLTDADIAPQSAAFRAAQERAALKNRAGLMERASAEGIADSEAVRAQGRAIEQQSGQAIGANDAALLTQSMTARREQLAMAMKIASDRGMQKEANDLAKQIANLDAQLKTNEQGLTREGLEVSKQLATLDANTKKYLAEIDAKLRREGYGTQERLALMDAEVRKLGIDTQGNIGQLEIALRRELGIGELNLGLLQTLLQNSQFNNSLGFDIGKWQSILNKEALMGAL